VAPTVLWELGADVIPMAVEPDGFNINAKCGSTHPETLQEHVVMHGADIGIALDGDADRVVLVCEKGNLIDGDQLMATIADLWKKDGRLAGNGLVATVMSNLGLERFIGARGLSLGAHTRSATATCWSACVPTASISAATIRPYHQ